MLVLPRAPKDEFERALVEEIRRLSDVVDRQADLLRVAQSDVAPVKPRKGDIRYADGTNWNPGSGAGFYGYTGSAWTKF